MAMKHIHGNMTVVDAASKRLDNVFANGVKVYVNTLDGGGEDGNRTAVGFQKVAQFQHEAVL